MGRTKDAFIKDLRYERFWVISFSFRDDKYVLSKPVDVYKFLPINQYMISQLPDCKVVKFYSEEEAQKVLTKIPYFDINGRDVSLEVLENSFHQFLAGV